MSLLHTVLLCALPASGKSETRKVLRSFSKEDCINTFRIGETVDLDDYPYVHFMRKVDEALVELELPRMFYAGGDAGFKFDEEWVTLMHLINEDYRDVIRTAVKPEVTSAADWLCKRLDVARKAAGFTEFIADVPKYDELMKLLEKEAEIIFEEKYRLIPDTLEGRTIVIEFARGGKHESTFPLAYPMGYQSSLAALDDELLKNAAMLYVKVTPEQSRAKNHARSHESAGDPNNPHLSLNHGVPISVMMNAYGCDDVAFLMEKAQAKGVNSALLVEKDGKDVFVPIALFDNTEDYTTFARGSRAEWPQDKLNSFRAELVKAFGDCFKAIEKCN